MWGRCPGQSVSYNIYKEMHLIRGRKVGKMNIQAIFFLENILRFGKLSYLCIRFPEIKTPGGIKEAIFERLEINRQK